MNGSIYIMTNQEISNPRRKKKRLQHELSFEDIEYIKSIDSALHQSMQKYRAAMSMMEVRFEILDAELELHKKRNPIHHVESRLKTLSSIFEKLQRYNHKATLENMEEYIFDVAGVRVICSYIQDVYSILDRLRAQDDLEIVKIKDYIANPKPNGYRSLHVVVKIPVYSLNKKEMIPVEVQLRTIAMDFWASLEHDLRYKAVEEITTIDAAKELKECSEIIEGVEARMQVLAQCLEDQSEINALDNAENGSQN